MPVNEWGEWEPDYDDGEYQDEPDAGGGDLGHGTTWEYYEPEAPPEPSGSLESDYDDRDDDDDYTTPEQSPGPTSPPSEPLPPQSPEDREGAVLDEIERWYQETLGRSMDPGERATEYGAYQRHGGEALRAQLRNRAGNRPGGDSSGTPTGTPGAPRGGGGGGGGGSRYVGPMQGPAVDVGTDPFSQLIQGGYADLLSRRGQTPFGGEMEEYLRGLLERGGEIEEDPSLLAQRMEAARQPIEAFRRMQTNQGRAELANRGLISEPGVPQGPEMSFLANLDESLAPWYASAGQNLASELARERGSRFDRALALGTGFASQQAGDYLNALRGGTERQATLSDIALGTLDRNIAWNRFLAEFGMDRDIALETLQSGRIDDVNELLDLFQDYVNASREGYR